MKPLVWKFAKRIIIIPLVLTAMSIAIVSINVTPKVNASIKSVQITEPVVDISEYNLVKYKKFSELSKGDYAATITVESVSIKCAVCYDSSEEADAVCLVKQSKEPWNNGSVALIGDNEARSFKRLHNAVVGTDIEIDFYKNPTCNYKVTAISYNCSEKDIYKKLKENNLVICVPYYDFESTDGSLLYTIYEAELGGNEQ